MIENLKNFRESLCYEEGVDPLEVSYSMQKKWSIDIRVTISVKHVTRNTRGAELCGFKKSFEFFFYEIRV